MLTAVAATAVLALEPLLVREPGSTMLKIIPGLAAVQFVAAYRRTSDGFSSLLATILALLVSPLLWATFVLFGAPITANIPATFECVSIISLFAVQPMIAVYNLEYEDWIKALRGSLPLTDVYGGFLGGILGSWVGAIPIALDWDRPWQVWPLTILLGATAGVLLGNVIGTFSADSVDPYKLKKRKSEKKHPKIPKDKQRP